MSVRADPMATISTPISREDLENDVKPTGLTFKNPQHTRQQLWEEAMAQPVDIENILRLADPGPKAPGVDKKLKKH